MIYLRKSYIIFIVLCILTLLLDWSKWDIAKGEIALLENILIIINIIINIALVILCVIISVKIFRASKFASIFLYLVLILTIALQTILPVMPGYIKINYYIYQQQRKQVVEMYEKGGLEEYRADIHEYNLPINWRLLSHTGNIYIGENKEVLFYVHVGIWKSSAILYVPDGIPNGIDIGSHMNSNIIYLGSNWYGIII